MVTSDFLTAYPDASPLYKKLAQCLDIPQEQIYLSAGSDAGIKGVFEVYLESEDEVVIIHPTYTMYYVYSQIFNARLIEVNFDENLSLSAERIIDKISSTTKLICIADKLKLCFRDKTEEIFKTVSRTKKSRDPNILKKLSPEIQSQIRLYFELSTIKLKK